MDFVLVALFGVPFLFIRTAPCISLLFHVRGSFIFISQHAVRFMLFLLVILDIFIRTAPCFPALFSGTPRPASGRARSGWLPLAEVPSGKCRTSLILSQQHALQVTCATAAATAVVGSSSHGSSIVAPCPCDRSLRFLVMLPRPRLRLELAVSRGNGH